MIVCDGKHYLYRHIRLDTNEVFYVGIGTKHKKWYTRSYNKTNRNIFWKRVVEKTDYEVEIVLESDDYDFIQQKEIEFIALYGRRNLGTGTIVTPYVINSTDTNTTYSAGTAMSLVGTTFNNTAPDQTVVLTQGGATTITGTYPNFTITSTDSNTTYSAGTGLALVGTVFSVENLQKVITYPTDFTGTNYTLTNADNNYEIIIDNGATAVTITVPSGLISKIGVGFTQKGTGDVSYTASGTTINNPVGLKIKGQYYQTFLSQESNTNLFYLGGNTKI